MKKLFIAVALSSCFFPLLGNTQIVEPPQENSKSATNTDAKKRALLLQKKRELAFLVAPVKSAADLSTYVKMTPTKDSPLKLLSPASQRRFLASLTFNEKGLTGYYFADLENELSPTQIYQVLSLFGSQDNTAMLKRAKIKNLKDKALIQSLNGNGEDPYDPDYPGNPWDDWGDWGDWGGNPGGDNEYTPKDYINYQCSSRATCSPLEHRICKASC